MGFGITVSRYDVGKCDINQKLLGRCQEDGCEKCRREFWLKEIER